MDRRLNGLNPLAYMGTNPITPPDLVINNRTPTVDDSVNFNIGTFWLVRLPNVDVASEVWMLVELIGITATWVQLYPNSATGVTTYPCDNGTAVEVGGVLNMLGD